MSTHPNVILMAVLTPDDLSRKTMREILEENGVKDEDGEIKIDGVGYHPSVMESEYDEGWQISAKEGELVFHDLITYGYGDVVTWTKLEARKVALEAWAKATAEKHHCKYRIDVAANYW